MKGKYSISATFIITGRGLVFTGRMIEGLVKPGDFIEFEAFNKKRKRKITGIDAGRDPNDYAKVGVLIKCESDEEIAELRRWTPNDQVGVITED